MDANLITIADVREAKEKNQMVTIKCSGCGKSIRNTLGMIRNYVNHAPHPDVKLNHCILCKIKTEIAQNDIAMIKRLLE